MKNFATDQLTIGVVGAGAMGRGIVQLAAQAGIAVKLYDLVPAAVEDAISFVDKMLDRGVAKGRMSAAEAEQAKNCITMATDLRQFESLDIVIEAVAERLDIKQQLFASLEAIVSEQCILATNTSSLSVTEIAASCTHPERVLGCHFFNPVPLMKLVEVIGGLRTDSQLITQLLLLVKRLGHTPVSVADTPGFLVNHSGRGLVTEGAKILQEQVAPVEVVDEIMRDCAGFRMGPFELMDLTGLDVTFPASEQIYRGYFEEPRLRPTPLMRLRRNAGLLGRKSQAGFYQYQQGAPLLNDHQVTHQVPHAEAGNVCIWLSPAQPEYANKLGQWLTAAGCILDCNERPADKSIILVTPLGLDATNAALAEQVDPKRTVAIDMFSATDKRVTVMANPMTDLLNLAQVVALLTTDERKVSVVRDSAGFVAQRILACIVNIGCEIAQQGVAAPQDIDTGAKLGLSYPKGPLALGDHYGAATVLTILTNIYQLTLDPRYRPSAWLQRRAALGLSLHYRENFSY